MVAIVVEDVARNLKQIYSESFGGKDKGRFQISRKDLRMLSGRSKLRESFLIELEDECISIGLTMTSVDDSFMFIAKDVLSGFRKVTKAVLSKYVSPTEEEEPSDDDEW